MNKKIIIAVLLAPILIFAGVKGFVWYSVKSSVDTALEQISPFVDIQYGSVQASLKGLASMDDITIQPVGQGDVLAIGSVAVDFGSMWAMLDLKGQAEKGKLPTKMKLLISKFSLPITDTLMDSLQDPEVVGALFASPDALGCGDLKQFDIAAMQAMGFTSLDMDFDMGYEFVSNSQELRFEMSGTTAKMSQGSLKVRVALGVNELNRMALMRASPALRGIHAEYKDLGYYANRNRFCAKKAGVTVEQFVDQHTILAAEFYRKLGFKLSDQVIAAYKQFISKPLTLKVAIAPDDPLELYSLAFYKPEDVIDVINLRVTLGSQTIDLNGLGWDPKVIAESMPELPLPGVAQAVEEKAKKESDARKHAIELENAEPHFREVDPYQLDQYIGYPLKAKTSQGQRVFGTILRVELGSVTVERRAPSGKMTFPIQIDQITIAEIFH